MISETFFFVGGFVSGVGCSLAYGTYLLKTSIKKDKRLSENNLLRAQEDELTNKLIQELSKLSKPEQTKLLTEGELSSKETVSKRLKQAAELTLQQNRLSVKNDDELHAFHNLELEKLTILKTIINDGFDPLIVIRYTNGEQEVRLSNYINQMQKGLN